MSGRNEILERNGGHVSEVNIFERRDLASCVKEKSHFNFGCNYLPDGG